jgi:hypothetical protein
MEDITVGRKAPQGYISMLDSCMTLCSGKRGLLGLCLSETWVALPCVLKESLWLRVSLVYS